MQNQTLFSQIDETILNNLLFGTSLESKMTLADKEAIEKLRASFEHKDFETRYALECFVSQCSHVLTGKYDQLIGVLNACKNETITYKVN